MPSEFERALSVPEDLLRLAEAFVFASPEPVTARDLAPLLPEGQSAYAVLEALQAHCAGRGVVLSETDGAWSFRTAPDLAERLRPAMTPARRLPRAAMEVLAAIALHQPVTRAEVEEVRGATLSQGTVDLLLEAGLIRPAGQRAAPGRPTLWATTPRFLAQFGLRSLHELPGADLPLTVGNGGSGRRRDAETESADLAVQATDPAPE